MKEELTGVAWVTREGCELDLAVMSDEHLRNSYKMIVQNWPWRFIYITPVLKEMKLRGFPMRRYYYELVYCGRTF
jgi:hypothetical protein